MRRLTVVWLMFSFFEAARVDPSRATAKKYTYVIPFEQLSHSLGAVPGQTDFRPTPFLDLVFFLQILLVTGRAAIYPFERQ